MIAHWLREERQRLWLEMAHGPNPYRESWTQAKADRVVAITRSLHPEGHADVLRWSLLHQIEDKERKQRERAGYRSRLVRVPQSYEDDQSIYLWEIAEGIEPGDGAEPDRGLRFSITAHDVAVAAVDWLLRQKPHWLTEDEWTYLELRGRGLTRQEASLELGYAKGWGSRLEARMEERLDQPAPRPPRIPWESGGELRRFWAVQYGNGPRMRSASLPPTTSIHGRSLRNGEWIDVGYPDKAPLWGRPPRSESERRREVYEMELAKTRRLVRVYWFSSFTEGYVTRHVNPGEELIPKRPYIGEEILMPTREPRTKAVNMNEPNGNRLQFEKWEVYAFECFPNRKREVWYSAKNGGPPVYAKTPTRLLEKMKAAH
jgi:hypothetical protein